LYPNLVEPDLVWVVLARAERVCGAEGRTDFRSGLPVGFRRTLAMIGAARLLQ